MTVDFPIWEKIYTAFWDFIYTGLASYGIKLHLNGLDHYEHVRLLSALEIDSEKLTEQNGLKFISEDVLTLLITALPSELQSEFSSSC